MSALPSRTRSLHRTAETKRGNDAGRGPSQDGPAVQRTSKSPSRLPVKPQARSSTTISRPPSGAGNVSIGPPSLPRVNIGIKAAVGGLQRSASNRRSNNLSAADPEPAKKDRSRPPITTSRHVRHTSTSSVTTGTNDFNQAHQRSFSTHSATPSLRPPVRGVAEELKFKNPQAESLLRKPAFSTLQQHFSPAKSLAPKPHPAAFLAPPSPSKLPLNIAISAETAKLQNELLQLHLLHRDARHIGEEWRMSAKAKLGSRFRSVVEKNDQLLLLEVKETGDINAAALKSWQDLGVPGWGLEEKIQVLGEVISGVWNLIEAGGRYAKTVRSFEKWVTRCQAIIERREYGDGLKDDEVMFVEELDTTWKDDCVLVSRKLETWSTNLASLQGLDYGSSLSVVVDGTGQLVGGMLQEVGLMVQIEQEAMGMELEWIKSMNTDSNEDKEIPTAGAVWRAR